MLQMIFRFNTLILLLSLISYTSFASEYKTVIKIESCAVSMRCRVYFNDGSTDLLFNPYIGMKILVKKYQY